VALSGSWTNNRLRTKSPSLRQKNAPNLERSKASRLSIRFKRRLREQWGKAHAREKTFALATSSRPDSSHIPILGNTSDHPANAITERAALSQNRTTKAYMDNGSHRHRPSAKGCSRRPPPAPSCKRRFLVNHSSRSLKRLSRTLNRQYSVLNRITANYFKLRSITGTSKRVACT